ncbi:MAG: chemotaxis protein CheD [Myxococcota bacterium]
MSIPLRPEDQRTRPSKVAKTRKESSAEHGLHPEPTERLEATRPSSTQQGIPHYTILSPTFSEDELAREHVEGTTHLDSIAAEWKASHTKRVAKRPWAQLYESLDVGGLSVMRGEGVIRTVPLGHSVAMILFDPEAAVGAVGCVLHPDSRTKPKEALKNPVAFADRAVHEVIAAFELAGGNCKRAVACLVGGGIYDGDDELFNAGRRNVRALHAHLRRARIRVHEESTGGPFERTMSFDVQDAKVIVSCDNTPSRLIRLT